uniref:hypothetical protein n=1 Tax=Paraburkholderia terrae TaxID=311230 RepID=UPI00296AFEBF
MIPSPGDWWRDFLLFGFGFWVLLRKQCGLVVFALASALCLRDSRVAPVWGGTYFSLPPRNYSALVNWYQAVHSEGHDEDARHQGPDTGAEG